MTDRLQKWQSWISEDLFQDVVGLFYEQTMYRQYWDIVLEAPEVVRTAWHFHSWVRHNYGRAVALTLRRQNDNKKEVISLRRLMEELERSSDHVTRTWRVSLAGPDEMLQRRAEREFDQWGGDHVDETRVREDIDRLESATAATIQWVNTTVAHLSKDRNELDAPPSYADLHRAVDLVIELYKSYSSLLTGSHPAVEELLIDSWDYIFEIAWAPAQ